MLYGLVLVVHVLVALFLITVILVQGGRGGLGEAMGGAAAQSLFGGGANTVMTKITAVAGAMFMVTCLSLAALSTARGRSVIDQLPAMPDQLPLTDQLPFAPLEAPDAQSPDVSAQPPQPVGPPGADAEPPSGAPEPTQAPEPAETAP